MSHAGHNPGPQALANTMGSIEQTDELQQRLTKEKWSSAEVALAYINKIPIKRDELHIRHSQLPVRLLSQNLSQVRRLKLWTCDMCTELPGHIPLQDVESESRGESDPSSTNKSMEYLYLREVTGLSALGESNIRFTGAREVELSHCDDVKFTMLQTVFPALEKLLLWSNKAMYDTQLHTLRRLRLENCGVIHLPLLQQSCNQLELLEVWKCSVILNISSARSKQWNSLKELELEYSHVVSQSGQHLTEIEARGNLASFCKNAEIVITHYGTSTQEPPNVKIISSSLPSTESGHHYNKMRAQTLGSQTQQVYQDIFLKGTRKVRQTRIMLVGHIAAGKTSLTKSLVDDGFINEHKSTDGMERLDELVVVKTAGNWQKVSSDLKSELIREVTQEFERRISEGDDKAAHLDVTPIEAGLSETAEIPKEEAAGKTIDEGGHKEGNSCNLPGGLVKKLQEMELDFSQFSKSDDEGEEVRFTIWDFGGQHVYYTSHQTFLSNRAIYLLVMDISKPLNTVIDTCDDQHMWKDTGSPRTALDILDFWLNSIHTHLKQNVQSDEHASRPPVIIVCTKTDLLDKDENKRSIEIEDYISSLFDHLQGKPYAQHVCEIVAVSNRDVHDEGITKLQHEIVKIAERQPYWGEDCPMAWLLLADELTKRADQAEGKQVIMLDEVYEAANRCGVPRSEVKDVLKYHHSMGDLVYFDEAETRDTVIVSPQWLASMFSKVLIHDGTLRQRKLPRDQIRELQQGKICEETALELCGTTQAPTIVKIMEKFDMLVPCQLPQQAEDTRKHYLIPCLLPRVAYQKAQEIKTFPKIHFKLSQRLQLGLSPCCNCGFLPHGLFHRLISCCCRVREWNPREIFYDYIVIGVQNFFFSLSMVYNGITMSAFGFSGKTEERDVQLTKLRKEVQSMIEGITKEVFPNLVCEPYLECNCSLSIEANADLNFVAKQAMRKRGFISMKECDEAKGGILCCGQHKMIMDTEPWKIWFTDPEVVAENPTVRDGTFCTGLEPHMSILLECMSYRVLDQLIAEGVLSYEDGKKITTATASSEQNRIMYTLLRSRVETKKEETTVIEAVCKGLCETSQYCPLSKQQEPASTAQRKRLREMYILLKENMDVSPVLNRLIAADIVDQHMHELIEAGTTRHDRVTKLLRFISHTHRQAHYDFMDILRDTHGWLMDEGC